jgi:hypothetical protein
VYAHDAVARNRAMGNQVSYTTKFVLPDGVDMGSFNLSQEIEDPFLVL